PYTVQPCFSSSAARLPPTIPVLPAIRATRPLVMFLLAPPTADTSGLIYHEFSPSWDPLRFCMLRLVSSKPQAVDSEALGRRGCRLISRIRVPPVRECNLRDDESNHGAYCDPLNHR